MKIASAILIAATWAVLAEANAQPFNRRDVCAVLAVADSAVLADYVRADVDFSSIREGYNFEPATYDCEPASYPPRGEAGFPSYFSIGFSDDNNEAMLGVEPMPDVGRDYVCLLDRSSARQWEVRGCEVRLRVRLGPLPTPVPLQ